MSHQNAAARKLLVESPLTVRTYDIDFIGHVNNIVYIRWLEDLRIIFLETHYPLKEMMRHNFAPVIAHTNIHYKHAINLFDEPVGRVWLEDVRLATFVLGQEFIVRGQVMASATQRGCFVNIDTSKIIRIPDRLREKYDAAG